MNLHVTFRILFSILLFEGSASAADYTSATHQGKGFWIEGRSPEDKFMVHTSTESDYNQKCEIPPGTENKILNCLVDTEETNLNSNGLNLQFGAAGNMCRHLVRDTYWYYDKSVGTGPSKIEIRRTYDAADNLSSIQCNAGSGFGPCDNSLSEELEINFVDATEVDMACTYDCCTGDYTKTITEDHSAAGGVKVAISTEQLSWGDSYFECIGGAGKDSWDYTNDSGIPMPTLEDVPPSGINANYSLTAPNANSHKMNLSIANYFDSSAHLHSGPISKISSHAPFCVEPIEDLSGDPIVSGNKAYSFYCLNDAYDVLNIINVYVREWDTIEEFSLFNSSAGASGNPDKGSLLEGIGCSGLSGFCNDFYDLDDFFNFTNGGSYNTSDPSVRTNLFPYQN